MRDYGRSSSTAHRTVHRLAALGVIALQSTLGRAGGVRFTFGVRYWRRSPIRRAGVARIVAGQVGAFDEPRDELDAAKPRANIPESIPKPAEPARERRERPTFGELMRRNGFDVDVALRRTPTRRPR